VKQPLLRRQSVALVRATVWVLALLFAQFSAFWVQAQLVAGGTKDTERKAEAVAWPEADRLFHADPLWLGGDAAFSVDLGGGRVLWQFGDSFIAAQAGATRKSSTFVRNSVAIQTGNDPARATIRFYSGWRNGTPSSFLPSDAAEWFWPLHGIRLGSRLLLFYMREARDLNKSSLGFQSVGWSAFLVDNPDADPSQWKPRKLDVPETGEKVLAGMSVLVDGEYVDAFVLDDGKHDAYLLRWKAADAQAGRLADPQWWCGVNEGWQRDFTRRRIVIANAGSEFSVQRDLRGGFLEVNSAGFGASTIVMRHAAAIEGRWSDAQELYRPPESDAPHAFVYGAKSHPELQGADLVVTYAANGSDERLANDMSIYFPRFVRITFHEK